MVFTLGREAIKWSKMVSMLGLQSVLCDRFAISILAMVRHILRVFVWTETRPIFLVSDLPSQIGRNQSERPVLGLIPMDIHLLQCLCQVGLCLVMGFEKVGHHHQLRQTRRDEREGHTALNGFSGSHASDQKVWLGQSHDGDGV